MGVSSSSKSHLRLLLHPPGSAPGSGSGIGYGPGDQPASPTSYAWRLKRSELKKIQRKIHQGELMPFLIPDGCVDGNADGVGWDPVNGVDELECPICMASFPMLNRVKCCGQSICTECFIMAKLKEKSKSGRSQMHEGWDRVPPRESGFLSRWLPGSSHPGGLHGTGKLVPAECPFCKHPELVVTFTGPRSPMERQREREERASVHEAKCRMRMEEIERDRERMESRSRSQTAKESESGSQSGSESASGSESSPSPSLSPASASQSDPIQSASRSRSHSSVSASNGSNGLGGFPPAATGLDYSAYLAEVPDQVWGLLPEGDVDEAILAQVLFESSREGGAASAPENRGEESEGSEGGTSEQTEHTASESASASASASLSGASSGSTCSTSSSSSSLLDASTGDQGDDATSAASSSRDYEDATSALERLWSAGRLSDALGGMEQHQHQHQHQHQQQQ